MLRSLKKRWALKNPIQCHIHKEEWPSFLIHPWVWKEQGAHRDLCKYGLDSSGKFVSHTPFSKENVPLNKQRRMAKIAAKSSYARNLCTAGKKGIKLSCFLRVCCAAGQLARTLCNAMFSCHETLLPAKIYGDMCASNLHIIQILYLKYHKNSEKYDPFLFLVRLGCSGQY